jgi:hypothetical protein
MARVHHELSFKAKLLTGPLDEFAPLPQRLSVDTAGRPPRQCIQPHTYCAGGERRSYETRGHPKGRPENGGVRQAVRQPASVRDETGRSCTERQAGLLNGGNGRGGNVLFTVLCSAHDALRDEGPTGADADANQ